MPTAQLDQLVEDYLTRVTSHAAALPPEQRDELVTELRDHIATRRAESGSPDDEATVRTILDQLGDPRDIAAAARHESAPEAGPAPEGAWQARAALLLLLLGGLAVPVVGWVVGVVLLWTGNSWSTRQKLAGTLLTPGGFGFAVLVLVWQLASGSASATCDAGGMCQQPSLVTLYARPVIALACCAVSVITVIALARRRNATR